LQFPEFTERRQASIQLGGVRALSGLLNRPRSFGRDLFF
jgi:hypothetical protein